MLILASQSVSWTAVLSHLLHRLWCCLSTYGLRDGSWDSVAWLQVWCWAHENCLQLSHKCMAGSLELGLKDRWMDGCSFGCSSPLSGFHKLSKIVCFIWTNSMAFLDSRQTLDLTCVHALSQNNWLVVVWPECCQVWISRQKFAFGLEELTNFPRLRAVASKG